MLVSMLISCCLVGRKGLASAIHLSSLDAFLFFLSYMLSSAKAIACTTLARCKSACDPVAVVSQFHLLQFPSSFITSNQE